MKFFFSDYSARALPGCKVSLAFCEANGKNTMGLIANGELDCFPAAFNSLNLEGEFVEIGDFDNEECFLVMSGGLLHALSRCVEHSELISNSEISVEAFTFLSLNSKVYYICHHGYGGYFYCRPADAPRLLEILNA